MEEQATINDLRVSLMRAEEEIAKLRKALRGIENAIIEEEKMPSYHKKVIDRHRMEWGALHIAIDKAIEVLRGK